MTDNEIVKALDVHRFSYGEYMQVIIEESLSLINRQKADLKFAQNINHLQMEELQRQKVEIERLNDKLKKAKDELIATIPLVEEDIKTAKAEAIKEFAERLQSKLAENTHLSALAFQAAIYDMHNLVKEMVGDTK